MDQAAKEAIRDKRIAHLTQLIREMGKEDNGHTISIGQTDWSPLSDLCIYLDRIYFTVDELVHLQQETRTKIYVTPRTDRMVVLHVEYGNPRPHKSVCSSPGRAQPSQG